MIYSQNIVTSKSVIWLYQRMKMTPKVCHIPKFSTFDYISIFTSSAPANPLLYRSKSSSISVRKPEFKTNPLPPNYPTTTTTIPSSKTNYTINMPLILVTHCNRKPAATGLSVEFHSRTCIQKAQANRGRPNTIARSVCERAHIPSVPARVFFA